MHSAAWDLLGNPLWAAPAWDPSEWPGIERNDAWRHFMGAPGLIDFDDEHAEKLSSNLVADLREATGRYPCDAGLAALVSRLRAGSPDFRRR